VCILETKNLNKVFGKGETSVRALHDVNFRLKSGEFVAVMGPSGCGKSTLLNMIGGLDEPTSGEVILDGVNLSSLNDNSRTRLRRQKIGFIFQFFNLIPVLKAVENAALPLILDGVSLPEARGTAVEWLKRLGLEDRLNHLPSELSGGQQQRVAIARALVTNPVLILADEPTGNLDSRTTDDIASLLRKTCREWERTILIVTHNPRISSNADRIVFLKDGSIVDDSRISDNRPPSQAVKVNR
jgi:putative ABC transport system ATP-binding protein